MKNSLQINWYANKKKHEICHYINNKEDGEWIFMTENGKKFLLVFFIKLKKYKLELIAIQNVRRINKLSIIMVLKFLNYVGTTWEI